MLTGLVINFQGVRVLRQPGNLSTNQTQHNRKTQPPSKQAKREKALYLSFSLSPVTIKSWSYWIRWWDKLKCIQCATWSTLFKNGLFFGGARAHANRVCTHTLTNTRARAVKQENFVAALLVSQSFLNEARKTEWIICISIPKTYCVL